MNITFTTESIPAKQYQLYLISDPFDDALLNSHTIAACTHKLRRLYRRRIFENLTGLQGSQQQYATQSSSSKPEITSNEAGSTLSGTAIKSHRAVRSSPMLDH
jgi:hypothetical protein